MGNIQEYNEFKKLVKEKGFDRKIVLNRIIEIAKAIVEHEGKVHGSVTMRLAGRIARQCQHCTFDDYWDEKVSIGKQVEKYVIESNYNEEHPDYKFWEIPKEARSNG